MPDEIDLASEQEQRFLAQAIANAGQVGARLTPKGRCYFCETDFPKKDKDAAKKLFCDADCSADYEREQKLRARR